MWVWVEGMGGCLLSLRVCVCLCMGVCVCLRVCVFVCVCVCRGGGRYREMCAGVGTSLLHRWCWCGSSASVLQKWYQIRTNFARNLYEIRAKTCTKIVRISYEFRANLERDSSPKCTVNVIVTNFVQNSHDLRTNFDQFA